MSIDSRQVIIENTVINITIKNKFQQPQEVKYATIPDKFLSRERGDRYRCRKQHRFHVQRRLLNGSHIQDDQLHDR